MTRSSSVSRRSDATAVANFPPGLPTGPPDPIEPSTRDDDRAIETVLERIAASPERINELLSDKRVRELLIEIVWEEIISTAYEYAAGPVDVDEDLPYDTERHHDRLRNGG